MFWIIVGVLIAVMLIISILTAIYFNKNDKSKNDKEKVKGGGIEMGEEEAGGNSNIIIEEESEGYQNLNGEDLDGGNLDKEDCKEMEEEAEGNNLIIEEEAEGYQNLGGGDLDKEDFKMGEEAEGNSNLIIEEVAEGYQNLDGGDLDEDDFKKIDEKDFNLKSGDNKLLKLNSIKIDCQWKVANSDKPVVFTDEQKMRVAYHEGGHSVLARLLKINFPVTKVSVIPALDYHGITLFGEERILEVFQDLDDKLEIMYAGAASEEHFLSGTHSIGVEECGYSEKLGPLTAKPNSSEYLLQLQDEETYALTTKAWYRAKESIKKYEKQIQKVADFLFQHGELDSSKLQNIIDSTPINDAQQ
ncbi:unnamed protein product [Meloidogyne enterolobii]|uniref:Uncharacterized protein n=1 Tax=Meloidogyne enterolobii TaxID=390850 RepID=A0ACB0YT47_MELEN